MSDLRFFADIMNASIETERRLTEVMANIAEINERAGGYIGRCEQERRAALAYRGDRMPPSFFEATEGICAARIIMGQQ